MKRIYHFATLIAAVIISLSSCSKDNNTPDELVLPIITQINQASALVDLNSLSEEESDRLHELNFQTFIVNDLEEFPDCFVIDELWQDMNIDFAKYSVIVNYRLLAYKPIGHKYIWRYDFVNDQHIFVIYTTTDGDRVIDEGKAYIVRNAIVVNKIPSDSKVTSEY